MKNSTSQKPDIASAVKGLKAISHPTRLQILCLLFEKKECSVTEIIEYTGMSQSGVSQHLSKMKLNNILTERRDGNKVYYMLNDEKYEGLVDAICLIHKM